MSDGKDELRNRFEERTPDSEEPDDTEETDTTENTGHTRDTESTRSRSQYPMYLSEQLQDELDDTFKRFNAERTLDGKEEVEKHKDFLEGIVRAGLDQDWEEYVVNDA